MIRKIICVLLCLTLNCGFGSAFASGDSPIKLYEMINTDFSDGAFPSEIGTGFWGGATGDVYQPENEDSKMLVYHTGGAKEGRMEFYHSKEQIQTSENKTLIIRSKIKKETYNITMSLFRFYASEYFNALNFASDGFLYAGEKNKNIGRYLTGKWYDVAILIDYTNKTMSLYLDDVLIIKNQTISSESISAGSLIRIMHHDAGPGEDTLYLDDFQMYYADCALKDLGGVPELAFPENDNTAVDESRLKLKQLSVSASDVIDAYKSAPSNGVHPRIIATDADFQKVRKLIESNSYYKDAYDKIIAQADDHVIYLYPVGYVSGSLLTYSRHMVEYSIVLGFAYNMTGEQKYADKLSEMLVSVCGYSNWNPSHFLDEAEMAAAVAIGYDLIYHGLSDENKAKIETGLYEKGVKLGLNTFNPGDQWARWLGMANNWCQVCGGGLSLAGLALLDKYPDECSRLIAGCVEHMAHKGLQLYEPDGAYFEGPSYISYSNRFLAYLMAGLNNSTGSDFGLSESNGIKNSSGYILGLYGGTGSFNYNDATEGWHLDSSIAYFAKHFNMPEIASAYQALTTPGALDFIWYMEVTPGEQYPLDNVFYDYPMFTTRSFSQTAPDANIWAAIKGQKYCSSRMDLDGGSFVIDAMGIRWATDLGVSGSYDVAGYYDTKNNGQRYTYYQKKAEGHNTFVINPDHDADQFSEVTAPVIKSESGNGNSYAIIDMAPLYGEKVSNAQRGMMLYDNRSKIVVRDEITMPEKSEYYWFMHTDANVQIINSGKTAVLTKNGKRLMAQLVCNDDLEFTVSPGDYLPQTDTGVAWNPKTNRLTIHASDAYKVNLSVVFIPLKEEDKLPADISDPGTLNDWKPDNNEYLNDNTQVRLTDIRIDGVTMEEFKPGKYEYKVKLDKELYSESMPEITAYAPVNKDVQVFSASKIPGVSKISVRDQTNPDRYMYYTLQLELVEMKKTERIIPYPLVTELDKEHKLISPLKVTVSDVPQSENNEMNLYDNNTGTRWATQGNNHWLIMEYEDAHDISAVAMSVMGGYQRVHPIKISLSEDLENWDTVYEGGSSVGTEKLFYISFDTKRAKYVKLEISNSEMSDWNSITEFWSVQMN